MWPKMKIGDLIIIDEREQAWIDYYTEYLCLEKISEGFELSTRHNELLTEVTADYYDEDGEIELPDEINGKSVLGVYGGIFVGEDLEIYQFSECGEEGMGSIKFNDVKDENVKSFLQCLYWYEEEIILQIKEAIKK